MNINWKIRFSNKTFWLTIIPGGLLLIQAVLQVFGVSFEFAGIEENLLNVVNSLFGFLTILGIVADPTTPTLSDSERALNREYLEQK